MALELRTEPAFWVRLRRDRPLQRQGMFVPAEVFCGDAKTKKGGNTKSVFRLSSFYRGESFFVFTETEDTMKHILKRLIKANFRLERM